MYGATIGKTAILTKEGSTNQALCAILPNDIFHEYFLQQFLVKNRNILVTFGMGAGQPNVSQEIIRNFKYLIPHLVEQAKIASILSGVDAYIQNLTLLSILRIKLAICLILFATVLYYELYNTEKDIHHYHNTR